MPLKVCEAIEAVHEVIEVVQSPLYGASRDGEGRGLEDEAELLARAAEGLEPARNTAEPSPLRRYMRENFDALLALKAARGLSWPQLAVVLSKRGLTKSNGSPLDGNVVAVMAAQVRWERDPASRQKRKKGHRKGSRPTTASTSPLGPLVITPEPEAPEPTPAPAPPEPASEGDKLRVALARKRKDIGEPDTLTFGAEDRRRSKESKSDG
jgi:hypothetical protein